MRGAVEASSVSLHTQADFAGMRVAGRLAADPLDMIAEHIQPGITTAELDRICHDYIINHGGVPASLNYRGFPKATCISVNHVVCHGIPGERRLVYGDILNIDLAVIIDGWHGDTSRMYAVGEISIRARRLIEITYEAMMRGIAAVRPGATLGDIGFAIQSFVEPQGFSIVRDFCGHGVGRRYHEPPNVLHFGRSGDGLALEPGMFLTIEPMVNAGRPEVKILDDGWTAVTRDRSLSAQFEHSIAVTEAGAEIFTLSSDHQNRSC
jgi:methionyl aminopeptidase